MIKIDDQQIKDFERDLKFFVIRAYPFATKETVNSAAFKAQTLARQGLEAKFILRNKFTRQSIQVDKAKTLRVSAQAAFVGSIEKYMADQEFGSTRIKGGRKGIPLVTTFASGEGMGVQPRLRLARPTNKLKNIKLSKRKRVGVNAKQRNIIAIRQAAKKTSKFLYLKLGNNKQGIFKVTGGKKNIKLRLLHDLTKQSVTITPRPWLGPAVDATVLFIPKIYRDALLFQLRRHNLFTGS